MTTATTKLHISPLTPDLLPAILGPNLRELAAGVSYHSLQAFPEKSYGYVNLPQMEAEKVKKRLNGAILKGKKFAVEEARPSKRKHAIEVEDEEMVHQTVKKSKKPKNEGVTVEGRELSPDRKVKRGWTEPKLNNTKKIKDRSSAKTKSQTSSKYSEKEELLFRTQIPKNKTSAEEKSTRKRKSAGSAHVVHEFEKSTTIPTFLRTETSKDKKRSSGYRDGEGWVDEGGDLVEPERPRPSRRKEATAAGLEHLPLPPTQRKASKQTEAQDTNPPVDRSDSSSVSEESDSDIQNVFKKGDTTGTDEATEETSSSGTSESDSESISTSSDESNDQSGESVQSNEFTPPQASLHPLEALFKKPLKPASSQTQSNSQDIVKPSLEVQTAFSFFDKHDDDNDLPAMPMTPFTTQDWHSREIRSAAPTPDTAHPSRMGSVFNGRESEDETSDASQDESKSLQEPAGLQTTQTEFEKRFWEDRGENNRAWKARRRTVLKEKRQRENRARRPKNW